MYNKGGYSVTEEDKAELPTEQNIVDEVVKEFVEEADQIEKGSFGLSPSTMK